MGDDNPYFFDGLISLMKNSFSSIIEKVKGMKVLILDDEVSSIISLVCTHSYLLENEILLTVNITDKLLSDTKDENLSHLKAIYLISATGDNVTKVSTELKNANFKEYYIFFTGKVEEHLLELLAKNDVYELVFGVYEYMINVYALNDLLYHIGITNCNVLYNDMDIMRSSVLSKITNGLYSICCLTRQVPSILYPRGNVICQTLANKLQALINNDTIHKSCILKSYREFNEHREDRSVCALIILDRRDDALTPLMNQWTYEAMINELIGFKFNKIKIGESEYILNPQHDEFFRMHMYSEFADVEADLTRLIEESKNTGSMRGVSSNNTAAQDLIKLVESIPKSNQILNNVAKHLNILHELSRKLQESKLLTTGVLEQEMAVLSKSSQDALDELSEYLNDFNIPNFEKLRLTLIFTIAYSNDIEKINMLKDNLTMARLERFIPIVDHFRQYNPPNSALGPNLISRAKNTINKSILAKSSSPFLQHRSRVYHMLSSLIKGKLDKSVYSMAPALEGDDLDFPRNKPHSIIVFTVGGATFAEARDVFELMQANTNTSILYGGTCILDTRSFLNNTLSKSIEY